MKERTDVQVSKYDIPATGIPRSADGVVVSRLTRTARSPMLREPGGRPEGVFLCAESRDGDAPGCSVGGAHTLAVTLSEDGSVVAQGGRGPMNGSATSGTPRPWRMPSVPTPHSNSTLRH